MGFPRRPFVATVLMAALAVAVPGALGAQAARQGLLSLEDARLFYEVLGSGDPIVVVHGGPGLDHRYLRPGLDVLATRNTLVYYDQRGTGRSTTEVGPETITLEAFVEDIEALREALGHDRIHVLTHSFGSWIGLAYARQYPERVHSLMLLNPVEPGTRFASETARRRAEARTETDSVELSRLTTSEAFEARDPATLGRVFTVAFRAAMRDPDRVAELDLDLMDPTARQGQDVAELLGAALGSIDGWARLGEVEAPVLVVHGRYDPQPLEMSTDMAAAFPNGRLEVLESGHFPYVEDRDGLLATVSAFLAGLPRQ
ncbi:MAG: alpha/beta fold hydrolase [Gemmatimonadota bacterium]